jgi:hypothetical protein
MATENNLPTTAPVESASQPVADGGNVGGALSENDFIRNFKDKNKSASGSETKNNSNEGDFIRDFKEKRAASEVEATTDATTDDEDLDISDLDNDSAEHEATESSGDLTDTNAGKEVERNDDPIIKLQVDGKTIEVKQSELIENAQKYKASEAKFEEASKMRKEADEEKSFYTKDRDTLKNLLAQYQNFMNEQLQARQPDWNTLLQNDPAEYIRQKEYHAAIQQELAQAQAYQEQVRKQEELERKTARDKHLKAQQDAAFKLFPQWKNPDVRQRDTKLMESYLDSVGFTKAEQNGLDDARMLDVVLKAAKYDQAVKAKDQKKAKPTTGKTLTAGVSQTSDPGFSKRQAQTANARQTKAAVGRFKQEGTQDAFIEMFKNSSKNRK